MGISLPGDSSSPAAPRRRCLHARRRGPGRCGSVDLFAVDAPALTGKIELVYKGEQEGVTNVAIHADRRGAEATPSTVRFVGRSSDEAGTRAPSYDFAPFQPVFDWFEEGNSLEIDPARCRTPTTRPR
jgi:magnesium chelatase subunit I